MKYFYWVAYSHPRGFGALEMVVNGDPATTGQQVMGMGRFIEAKVQGPPGSVVILSFQLLRTES